MMSTTKTGQLSKNQLFTTLGTLIIDLYANSEQIWTNHYRKKNASEITLWKSNMAAFAMATVTLTQFFSVWKYIASTGYTI